MKPGPAEYWVRALPAFGVEPTFLVRDPAVKQLYDTCLMLALRVDTLDEQIEMLTERITQFEQGKQRKFLKHWGW